MFEEVWNRIEKPISRWTTRIRGSTVCVVQTSLSCIVERRSLPVSFVLGMRCKNRVDYFAKHSVMCKGTLGHFTYCPEDARRPVPTPPRPRPIQCAVYVEAGLVGARGQCTTAPGGACEKWGLEYGYWISGHTVLRLEVVAQVQAAIGIVAELYRNKDAQDILERDLWD